MKKEIKTFKDAWTLPFVKDPEGLCVYIWDSKGHMCFNFCVEDLELYDRVVKLLNGEDAKPFKGICNVNNHQILVKNDFEHKIRGGIVPLLYVRGHGYLCGCGANALGLTFETAARLQEELVEYCIKRLKGEKDE